MTAAAMNAFVGEQRRAASPVHRLGDALIDKIAAGEVVERPASVVKELVENALDAGARSVEIAVEKGGAALIRVADDGSGIAPADLPLAVSRHCTSKLSSVGDLEAIRTMGFRGEALPSIGAVARLSVASRTLGAEGGAAISVDGGRVAPVEPAARGPGTTVEVRDLFFATPARLKFMKSERSESGAISDTVKRLALSAPAVSFALTQNGRTTRFPAGDLAERARQVLGETFAREAVRLNVERDGVRLSGLLGLATDGRSTSSAQYFLVNGRTVRDRLIGQALRAGYRDVMAQNRHPAAVLSIDLDPAAVDVNVHPQKADVRFRDAAAVRGFIVSAVRRELAVMEARTSGTIATAAISALGNRDWEPPVAPAAVAEEGPRFEAKTS
ncbi:MAG: DNA mismatch repair endonuclease MutL, partial [Pseudomonadota bacterium]